jgi:threonine synthase
MNYYSLTNKQHRVGFREAVLQSIAPDGGLYFPEPITPLPATFFESLHTMDKPSIAYTVLAPFIGDAIPEKELQQIINETFSFDFPVVPIEQDIYTLELFHGPTLAFKDVGARFMSRCLAYFNRENDRKTTVLVATSGDTGGAVANGFLGIKNVDVVVLYPKGKVSAIQEAQLTTLGQNIRALEVQGSFDDCQAMVKKAFQDSDLKTKNLTSANSINVARWLPQMCYFFFAYKILQKTGKPLYVSCPSGNFGNIGAGMLAKKLGLPIAHFIAATNANDTVPRYLDNGIYQPKATISTVSNAMDVSDPSNFIRIQELYAHDLNQLKKDFSSYTFSDTETRIAMESVFQKVRYSMDPHGAVGYLGLQKKLAHNPDITGLFLETAHPVKFLDTVQSYLNHGILIPESLQQMMDKPKQSIPIRNYEALKDYLRH